MLTEKFFFFWSQKLVLALKASVITALVGARLVQPKKENLNSLKYMVSISRSMQHLFNESAALQKSSEDR